MLLKVHMGFLSSSLSQFLSSGFEFSPQEELLRLRLKLFNSILGLIVITAGFLSFTYFVGLFSMPNHIQGFLSLLYVLFMIFIIFYLRHSKQNYTTAIAILMVSSLLIFGGTLYHLIGDQARIQWFGPTIMVMFLLGGKKFGFLTFFASIVIILTIHFLPYHPSDFTTVEIVKTLSVLFFIALMSNFFIDHFLRETSTLAQKVEASLEINRIKDEELLRNSKLAQMGELLSIISHQWKQPLSTISMYTADSIVGLEMGDVLSKEEQKQVYLSIEKQVRFLSKTMDDFRHFYNPNKPLKFISMPHVIEQAIEILESDMRKSDITVHTSFNFTRPLHSYPNEITQVMLILLKNAKDAHDDNKKNRHKRIYISGFHEKDLWVIEIRDNAGGISPENLPHIFKQFFTTKESEKGTGLGLYLCKSIIQESCKGRITAEHIDGGTLFRIKIPSQKR